MSSAFKALIWERWRRTRTVFIAASLPPLLLWIYYIFKITLFNYMGKKIILFDLPVKPFWYISFILLTGVLLMGHNEAKDLDLGFPKRLFRLPVSTVKLTLTHHFLSAAAIAVLFMLYLSSNKTYYGTIGFGWTDLLWFETVFFILQTISWAVSQIKIVNLALPSSVFIVLLIISERITALPGVAVILSVLITVCVITSLRIIAAYRKGSWQKVSGAGSILDILKRNPSKPFKSPLQAQIWFEFRRTAYLLPVFTVVSAVTALVISLINLISGISIFESAYSDSFGSTILISTVILFLIRYAILHRDKISGISNFWLRRPLPTHRLASAHTLGLLRGFILSSVIVFIVLLSNCLFNCGVSGVWDSSALALVYSPEHFNSAYSYFMVNILGLFGTIVIFWLILRLTHLMFAWILFVALVYAVIDVNYNMESIHLLLISATAIVLSIVLPLLMFINLRLKLITIKALFVSCLFYAATLAAVYTIQWDSMPYFLTQQYWLKICAAAMVPFIPVAVTPLIMNKMRHR